MSFCFIRIRVLFCLKKIGQTYTFILAIFSHEQRTTNLHKLAKPMRKIIAILNTPPYRAGVGVAKKIDYQTQSNVFNKNSFSKNFLHTYYKQHKALFGLYLITRHKRTSQF